jgi:asparagine synthase (glutamine-hydrolysing)
VHRWPNGSSWREFSCPAVTIVVGRRQLAIIDLSDGGLQTMSGRGRHYHFVFDREIYNDLPLREDLHSRGRVLTSGNDSEMPRRAYVQWGQSCLNRFLEIFSLLSLAEARERRLAAHDCFGIKQLCFAAKLGCHRR